MARSRPFVAGLAAWACVQTAEGQQGDLNDLLGSLGGRDGQGGGGLEDLLGNLGGRDGKGGGLDEILGSLGGRSGKGGLGDGSGLDEVLGRLGGSLGDLGGLAGGSGATPLCAEGEVPVPGPDNHKAFSANGCGPQGMKIDEPFGLHRCCNFHDVCFSTCATTHEWCEKEFKACMKRTCKQPESGTKADCKRRAASFSSMTGAFGQGFHASSQRVSCNCTPVAEAEEGRRQYLRSFLQEYDPDNAGDERIAQLLSDWKGREGQLWAGLVLKHGQKFIKFDDVPPELAPGSKKARELQEEL